MKKIICSGMVALIFLLRLPAADEETRRVFAIKDCRVATLSGPVLTPVTVLIRDGLIEAVGRDLHLPADAELIDGSQLMVYPGLIDALSQFLVKLPERKIDPVRLNAGEFSDADRGITPERQAFDWVALDKGIVDKHLRQGITVVNAIPEDGVLTGRSVVLQLPGPDRNRSLLIKNIWLGIGFTPAGVAAYPNSLMGVMAFLRQEFSDSIYDRRYNQRWAVEPGGLPRPLYNPRRDIVADFVAARRPVVFLCRNQHDIHRALALAEEFNLDFFIADLGNEAFRVIPELKRRRARVICGLTFRAPSSSLYTQLGKAEKEKAEKEIYPRNPARLAEAGIPLAFTSLGCDDPRQFMAGVRQAVDIGLDRDQALRALTAQAAEFLTLGKVLGSVESGKIANLVLCQGDLLTREAKIRMVFVDGRKFEFKEGAGGDKKPEVNVSGRWELLTESNRGMKLTVEFIQDEANLSGKVTTLFGVFDIGSGSVSGKEIYFEMSFSRGSRQIDFYFSAMVEGDIMKGQMVQGTFGSAEFRGRRVP